MSRESVVQEAWWEHHIVSSIPKLWVVLGIEGQSVLDSNESESGKD
jgi:hypothetical protein